jgi:large repetitive protein
VQGTTFKLSVNGKELADDRVGKKAVMEDKKLQAWEFIGADLVPGVNTLTVKQIDAFGNERGDATIKVTAPGNVSKLLIEFPQATSAGARADGKTPVTVVVRVVDSKGVAVASRTAVTLLTNVGRWQVEDLNAAEPGVQNFVQGGVGEFTLLPPAEPGQAVINARSGSLSAEARLDFLPDVRELLAVGVIEGVLNLRKLDTRALTPTRTQDGFEQEITHISRNWNGGKYDAGARAAMFIKGKIKGEYLLTLAYDSDKNTRERLFRDIQPDEFYPVYGDSSVRAFDAQSTGRFYVRVDNKKSYLLYGDYNTTTASEARKLANYNRSLTGLKQHFENDKISANIFASRDTTRQLLQEFKANGTSGPFTLANAKGLINSEKVEIITRDRSQTGVIIRTVPLARFADYELEPLTGRIILKAPVPTLDELFNPNSIRVTYEVDQGGEQFWVAGADAQIKLADNFEIGAMAVDDRNPVDKFRMIGVNAIAKLADKTFLIAEIAQTTRDRVGAIIAGGLSGSGSGATEDTKGEKKGIASRIEFRHKGDDIDALFYAGRADAKFDNISSSLSSGRTEIGGNVSYRIDEKTRLKAEMLRSEDLLSNGRRDGLLAAVERTLDNGIRVELGVRHARETQAPATTESGPLPTEVTSIRARLTGDIPGAKDAAAYVEAEVDPKDTDRKIAAIGGEYKLPNSGRLYGRHEFISSLTGPYGLNTVQRQNSSVIGISTDYMKDGNVFSEYRIRDAISGGDAEAALGLRNLWTLSDGLKLQTGFERVHSFSGPGTGESAALTFGLEYTASSLWKGSTRLELRDGTSSDSLLSTVAIASKINREWTFLGRNTYSLIKNQGLQSGKNEQERFQVGVAYRDTETDVWNGLARVEHRSEDDTTQPELQLKRTVELFSLHANWQPRRPFTFSGRYAAKWVNEDSNGIKARNNAHLLSARAIWEIAPRWDVSVTGSTVIGRTFQSRTYAVGIELGFMVMENLWLSGGYNFFGYRDEDFANGEYTNKGTYLRLRYKFDEDLFADRKRQAVESDGKATSEKSTEDVSGRGKNGNDGGNEKN